MKKILLFLGVFGILLTNQVNATEIAVVDIDQIIQNSNAMNKATQVLEEKKNKLEKQIEVDQNNLDKEQSSLRNQLKLYSQEVAQQKIMEFQQKVMEFQKKVRKDENNLQKQYIDVGLKVTAEIKKIITEMKKEKNSKYDFDIVTPSASVIYFDNNLDISAEVLKRLNKRLKNIKIN